MTKMKLRNQCDSRGTPSGRRLAKKNNEPDDRQDVGDFEQSDETVLKRHGHRSRSDTSVPNRMTTSGREGDDGEETQDADRQDARLHSPIHGESLCRVRQKVAIESEKHGVHPSFERLAGRR